MKTKKNMKMKKLKKVPYEVAEELDKKMKNEKRNMKKKLKQSGNFI
jgi:hypothetical protein